MEQPSLIDRALKTLIRRAAPAFFRLAHVEVDPRTIRSEDVTINLAEHRADQVFVIGTDDDTDRWAMHLEYQLEPDARHLKGWFLKNAALTAQLEFDVILTVVYLTRGRYATFPDAYAAERGALKNRFEFHVIRLWEHAERIRSGELRELLHRSSFCARIGRRSAPCGGNGS